MFSAVIVEDEVPASERLKVLLKDCDITVLASFRTAAPALSWFETHQADIVFVDIGLPEITGLQFVERLPHICKTVPAIIFIGYLIDTCKTAQDNFKSVLEYFRCVL